MIAFGFILILGALAVIILKVLDFIDARKNGDTAYMVVSAIGIFVMCGCLVMGIVGVTYKIKSYTYRYSAKDYRIETEVTTRGNTSDTTYIITRR